MIIENTTPPSFSGAVGLYDGEQSLLEKGFGFRDLANQLDNNTETLFATASAGKAFVAVAIMQLVEQGDLALASTLGELLPDELGQVDRQITIYELLTHTSVIQDYYDEELVTTYEDLWREFPNYRIRENSDIFPLFFNKPVDQTRRGQFHYNNSGYVMLAAVIEALTGMPFDKHLEDAIFAPLGMSRTAYYDLDRLPANTANAYCFDEARQSYYLNIYSVDAKGTGAGGCFTTLGDVRRFWQALLEGTLVNEATRQQMFSQQVTNGEEIYGLGFWLTELKDGQLVPYFEGMDPGICFFSLYDLENDINVTAISNKADNVWQVAMDFYKQVEK